MPRYAVTLNETASYIVIVDAADEQHAGDAAENVFLDAANINVFECCDVAAREVESVQPASTDDVPTQDREEYALTPQRSPVEKAAPDLLAALQFAVTRIEIANAEGNPILSAWLPDAKALIAKATGGAA